jgi:hypothetical protein
MQDWLLVIGPIALIAYFAVSPAQFTAFMDWLVRLF